MAPPTNASSAARRRLHFGETKKASEKKKEVIDLTRKPDNTGPPKKRNLQTFLSSPTTKTSPHPPKTSVPFVTPTKKSKLAKQENASSEDGEKDPYVPTYIHKNVHYLRKGDAKLDEKTATVFQLVEEYYHIPRDFDQAKEYGALSGSCHEERVISAYAHGMLEPKHPESDSLEICTECASTDHTRDGCPTLV